MMKLTHIIEIVSCLALAMLMPGCSDAPDMEQPVNDTVAEEASLTLNVALPFSALSLFDTRGVTDDSSWAKDKTVLFVFDQSDSFVKAFSGSDLVYVEKDGATKLQVMAVPEIAGPVTLLMLANVDVEKAKAVVAAGQTLDAAVSALNQELVFTVAELDGLIPMSGQLQLPNGLSRNSTGTIPMRRSLAKMTITMTYTDAETVPFELRKITLINMEGEAYPVSISKNPVTPNTERAARYEYEPVNDGEKTQKVTIFVPEVLNDKAKPIKCIMDVQQVRNMQDGQEIVDGNHFYYRLDFIDSFGKNVNILRNYHYMFTIENLRYVGSPSFEGAENLEHPDNDEVFNGMNFKIVDEDILSVTVEKSHTGNRDDEPDFIGVSSQTLQMEIDPDNADYLPMAWFYMLTDIKPDLIKFDFSGAEGTFEIVQKEVEPVGEFKRQVYKRAVKFFPKDKSTLNVGDHYTFYITGSTIRKEMTIEIVSKGVNN